MAISARRTESYQFTGDVTFNYSVTTVANAASPGVVAVQVLTTGANTITAPVSPLIPQFVTIIPPSGNTVQLTLKGVSGDTGIALHDTQPSTIAIETSVASFVINAASGVTIRLVWA